MLTEALILDASPVIVLGKTRLLGAVSPLVQRWIIPERVVEEVEIKEPIEPFLLMLQSESEVERTMVSQISPEVANWDLGDGESAVLTYGLKHSGCQAVLDDREARKCAEVLGLPMMGTLGVVLAAYRKGFLPSARESIDTLIEAGLYVHPSLLDTVYRAIDER